MYAKHRAVRARIMRRGCAQCCAWIEVAMWLQNRPEAPVKLKEFEMNGYLTPGEKQALRAGQFTWYMQEWNAQPLAEDNPVAVCDNCGAVERLGNIHDASCPNAPYEDHGDDSTTYGGYGEWD